MNVNFLRLHIRFSGKLPHVVDNFGGTVDVLIDFGEHGTDDVRVNFLLFVDFFYEEAAGCFDDGQFNSWAIPVAISPRVAILLA